MSCTARLYDGLTRDIGTSMREMAMPYGFIMRRFTPSDPLKGSPRYGLTVFNRRYEELFSVRLRRKPTKAMLMSVARDEWGEQIDKFNAGRVDFVQMHLHRDWQHPLSKRDGSAEEDAPSRASQSTSATNLSKRDGSAEEDADYTRRLRKFLGWKVEAPQKSNVVWPSVEQIESGERELARGG